MMRPPNPRRILAVLAVVCYAAMWWGYRHNWDWLDAADSAALDALHDVGVKHPGWVRLWEIVCIAFGPNVFRLAGAAAVVAFVVRRRMYPTLFLLAGIGLSGLVTRLAKGLADRPRPDMMLVAVHESSFPSGHAVAVMVGACSLLSVLLPMLGRRWRVAAILVGALAVLAVGFGRVALNVHHPSDVLAGWSLGYLYFLACTPLLASDPARQGTLRR